MSVRPYKDSKGRKRYSVEFEQRGHRVFRRLPPGATKGQADQLETRLKHDLIDQNVIGKRPNVSLKFAIENWLEKVVKGRKSATHTASHAAHVIRAVGDDQVSGLSDAASRVRESSYRTDSATDEAAERRPRGKPLAAGTINRRLCILKAVAKFAWRQGWTAENLSGRIQLIPEPAYKRREVTPDMIQKLIDNASTPRARALIAFGAYTGLRLGDILKLKPANVKGGVIVAKDTKNGTDIIIPILEPLKPHLAELPFKAGWRNVYRGWLRARKKAKLPIRYHDLRHLVGSALTNSGADLRVVADILGHKSLQTTRKYTHPNIEVKRRALEKALMPITPPIRKRAKAKKAA